MMRVLPPKHPPSHFHGITSEQCQYAKSHAFGVFGFENRFCRIIRRAIVNPILLNEHTTVIHVIYKKYHYFEG